MNTWNPHFQVSALMSTNDSKTDLGNLCRERLQVKYLKTLYGYKFEIYFSCRFVVQEIKRLATVPTSPFPHPALQGGMFSMFNFFFLN